MRFTAPIRLNKLTDAINWVPTVFTSSAHRKRVGERTTGMGQWTIVPSLFHSRSLQLVLALLVYLWVMES
jgi:hypothetical protein